jgi:hypothetical protein
LPLLPLEPEDRLQPQRILTTLNLLPDPDLEGDLILVVLNEFASPVLQGENCWIFTTTLFAMPL